MGALKQDLHKLIDSSKDEALLESFYMILSSKQGGEPFKIWENLTEEQKQLTLQAASKIKDKSQHISHEEMEKQHAKWLR